MRVEPMETAAKERHNPGLVVPSASLLSLFAIYLRWYIPRSFHALRVARRERFPLPDSTAAERLVIAINHPSWWDPLISILLSRHLLPGYDHYAPMEASALAHYRFMRRLGLFPVDNRSPRLGATQFLRTGMRILHKPRSVLWVTPEGRFTDVRQRPLCWKPGLATLLARAPSCTVVPLALEYTFWDERLPETLALIGEPIWIEGGSRHAIESCAARLVEGMGAAQDELSSLALSRSAQHFETVISGRRGVSSIYDLWKRTEARMTGRQYVAEHGGLPRA